MKKKFVLWAAGLYILYALVIGAYLFWWSAYGVPEAYQGTSADPSTFMTEKELALSQEYSRFQSFLYLVSIPLEWLVYGGILVFGLSRMLKQFGERVSKKHFVQIPIYVLFLTILMWLCNFPIDYISRRLSLAYGISTQSFSGWMRDELISFWLNVGISAVLITVLYFLMRKFVRRWWLFSWGLLVPFLIFMMFIQPVVIDPLYNDFSRLSNPDLEEKILSLAEQAGVPADRVYEVNMSEETNAMNAYVNGIGSNLRIVLWDTTLNKLEDKEVLFIMAHEIGHYVMDHLFYMLAGSIAASLIGLYLGYRLLHAAVRRWGKSWGVKEVSDIASLPALLLIFSLLSFAATPIELAISRQAEQDADEYAIEMTEDVDAAVGSFQELTVNSLSTVNPPALVKYLSYGHPTMMERIHMLENYQKEE
ncbi:M48 family metallopeptidase [Thalassobacillus pellis]|uniref:M48 family metallopeptidase n=1 Tax=Thalassobacillus pellis TaxID=748008 RepID=UPI0019618A88|nr:M48 family metallopeptidase [Thalassobacillus pellis]MBM7552060.1 Zn-dependent protease with chaperone function [Thalassobacillus pellis]